MPFISILRNKIANQNPIERPKRYLIVNLLSHIHCSKLGRNGWMLFDI